MTYIVINFLYTMQIVLLCVAGLEINYYLFIFIYKLLVEVNILLKGHFLVKSMHGNFL